MNFPNESQPETHVPESAPKVGRTFPTSLNRKIHPGIQLNSGTHFPNRVPSGNCIHSGREFWDTVSGCKKGHKTWPSTYLCSADTPMTSCAPTTGRLSGRRHIRFIASSARKGGHITWPSSCAGLFEQQTFPAPPSAADSGPRPRYLILVVPGARLGSVSLASVWKCSVYTFLPVAEHLVVLHLGVISRALVALRQRRRHR